MDGKKLVSRFVNTPNPNSIASKLTDLLKGDKYWTIQELTDLLGCKMTTVHTAVNRLKKPLHMQTYSEYNGKGLIKYYKAGIR